MLLIVRSSKNDDNNNNDDNDDEGEPTNNVRSKVSTLVDVTDEYKQFNDSYSLPIHKSVYENTQKYYDESPPRPQHQQSAVPPMDWSKVSQLDLQPRLPDDPNISNKDKDILRTQKLQRAMIYSM